MTTATPTAAPKVHRPMSRLALRRELESTREDLATAMHLINRAFGLTTDVWNATQSDEAPPFIPSIHRERERVA